MRWEHRIWNRKSETKYIKGHHTVQLLLNRTVHENHIWSFGEKNNTWIFVIFKKKWINFNVHLCFVYLFIYFLFYYIYFTILYWFCHTSTWIPLGCTRVPNPELSSHLPPHTIPLGHPSSPAPSILYPALNLHGQFVSYMMLYMFQCHSPKSFHPLPLSQSPKDCSVHLCLFCCLTYRVIVTIFSKFHIYALVYCIGVFLSGLLHSV